MSFYPVGQVCGVFIVCTAFRRKIVAETNNMSSVSFSVFGPLWCVLEPDLDLDVIVAVLLADRFCTITLTA